MARARASLAKRVQERAAVPLHSFAVVGRGRLRRRAAGLTHTAVVKARASHVNRAPNAVITIRRSSVVLAHGRIRPLALALRRFARAMVSADVPRVAAVQPWLASLLVSVSTAPKSLARSTPRGCAQTLLRRVNRRNARGIPRLPSMRPACRTHLRARAIAIAIRRSASIGAMRTPTAEPSGSAFAEELVEVQTAITTA